METFNKIARNPYADTLPGFAIVLVVLGHCIQEGSGLTFRVNQNYWMVNFTSLSIVFTCLFL